MQHRTIWVDMLRGFSMLAILWFHTEMYYAGRDVTPYALYVGDVLAAFFFLSGYLFYRETPVSLRHKLYGVFRWLLVPYLVFTSLLALPKAWAHHSFQGFGNLAVDVLTGQASWFVSALIVAELLFILTLRFFKSSWGMAALALVMLLAAAVFGNRLSAWHNNCNLWHVNEALLGYFFMTLGYYFHRYEGVFAHSPRLSDGESAPFGLGVRTVRTVSPRRSDCESEAFGLIVLALLFLLCKYLILSNHAQVVFGPIIVSNYPLFIADLIVSVLLLVGVFRRLPSISFLCWVGKRSIVYYFICGGVPLVVGRLLVKMGLSYSCFIQLFLAFAVVLVVSTAIVWLVYRYTHIVRKPNG